MRLVYPLDLCCDNCIRKKEPSRRFKSIYDLIGFLDTAYGKEPISHPTGDDNLDLESAALPKTWGNLRAGNRLTLCRQVLEDWRYDCWKRDYRYCSWGVTGVMPDQVLSKLASSVEIETDDNLLEAVSDWGYASKYSHEILLLLKDADHKQQLESQAQHMKTRQTNKKCKLGDLERNEEQQNSEGPIHHGPLAPPRTWMIEPIIVKHIPHPSPTRPQPPRPRPRPVLVSRPYTRTDIFDSLTNNSSM